MKLQTHFRKELNSYIARAEKRAKTLKGSLNALKKIDFNSATYTVNLYSLWADTGEKNSKTTHSGTLEDAVKKAEEQFKKKNHRTDVQAKYDVKVQIGEDSYEVPERYWES